LAEPGEGPLSLQQRLAQLEGLCLPAVSWEADILPGRIHAYLSSDLDNLCSTGKITWLRLSPPAKQTLPKSKQPAGKATAISFVSRDKLQHWRTYAPCPTPEALALSGNGQKVYAALKSMGASFFAELLTETGLLKAYLEEALAELAAWGLVTADSFQGLRTLITPEQIRHRRSKRYPGYDPFSAAGRWSLIRAHPGQADTDKHQHCEYIAHVLLRRYGVVFRKLLDQETILPDWRDLLYVFRRMEARGELRGGRFVQGFAGEQFALPNALDSLRELRKKPKQGELVAISAADPLNLTGVITPGQRIPTQASQRILYKDGVPIAVCVQGKVSFLETVAAEEEARVKSVLLRGRRLG
jgi:ATP-dependent Lhr-like helicase